MANDMDSLRISRIQELVHEETSCLNRGDLDRWMNLFTDDGYYWMPLDVTQISPDDHDSLIYDNRALMEMRRDNLGHALSPSMQLPVRSTRILSALHCQESTVRKNAIDVHTDVIAVIYHRRQDTFAGKVTYTIVGDGNPRIFRKRVNLINADGVLDAIMMYV